MVNKIPKRASASRWYGGCKIPQLDENFLFLPSIEQIRLMAVLNETARTFCQGGWGGVDWVALVVHLASVRLRHGIKVGGLAIGIFGVCLVA